MKKERAIALAAGIPRYLAAQPCAKGHLPVRYSADRSCCECRRLGNRKANASDVGADRKKRWRALNREKYLSQAAQQAGRWRKKYPAKANAQAARHRALRGERTPSWADHERIDAIYVLARERRMHVDHIIPLNGAHVSGLHVHENLQLLPGAENARKGNRYP